MCLWGRSLLIVPSTVTLLYCVCLSSVSILCSILPVSGVVHSRLSLQRLLCCIVFCLCSFCILCSMLPLSLGSFTLDCPFNGYFVVLCFVCLRSVSYVPYCLCLWGRPLLIVPSTVTLLNSVLFVFVLYLMLHIACVSRSSTLDCPFNGYFVVQCFACRRSVSYAPYFLCLLGRSLSIVPSTLLCCIVFCMCSFCILCSILPLSLGSSTLV